MRLPLPPPHQPSLEPDAHEPPAAGEVEGPWRRKLSRKRDLQPRFPGEAAGGVAQPAWPRSCSNHLHSVLKNSRALES